MRIEPGAIERLPIEHAPPDELLVVGEKALASVVAIQKSGGLFLEEQDRIDVNRLDLDAKSWEIVEQILSSQKGLLAESGVAFRGVRMWLIYGMIANIGWHPDRTGDVRFMTNIGPDTSVEVADEWDPDSFQQGYPTHTGPEVFHALGLPSGAAYINNNLVTDKKLLKPHQTPTQSDRLVLRTSYYAAPGWENGATQGGLAISLAVEG